RSVRWRSCSACSACAASCRSSGVYSNSIRSRKTSLGCVLGRYYRLSDVTTRNRRGHAWCATAAGLSLLIARRLSAVLGALIDPRLLDAAEHEARLRARLLRHPRLRRRLLRQRQL